MIQLIKYLVLLQILANNAYCKTLTECDETSYCVNKPHEFSSNYVLKKTLCELCFLTLPIARSLIESNRTKYFHGIATHLCEDLKIADSMVCDMAVASYESVVLTVVKETKIKSEDLCSVAMGCGVIKNPLIEWNITLPSIPKPPVTPTRLPKPDAPKIRILQLSDIHVDFEYQPGSVADCDQPLCCRNTSTMKKGGDKSAGGAFYWGDYRNCDIPLWTLENMFQHIAEYEKFDFIYWTGDLPPHNIWNQTRTDQVSALQILSNLFQKYFPNKPIYPTLGNHETQPCNLYPTPAIKEDSINWLYSTLATEWTKTGLPDELYSNIKRGAFYTIKLLGNLRLISLNTNYCPKENFWLLINSTDPLDQLDWLAKTLQFSETNNEKVHIIGHIHPAECLKSWSANYYRIVNRYEGTIAAQIFGHDHKDQFRIFYDLKNVTRAVAVSYLGPSVTTAFNLNPGYRIYVADGQRDETTWTILDHETKFLNLTETNFYGSPKWRTEYTARDAFGMDSLLPHEWSSLVDELLHEPFSEKANKIFRFYSKSSDNYEPCDLTCRKRILCSFKQSRSDHFIVC